MTSVPRILIVDDDKNNVLALEKVFRKEHMEVVRATSGKEAVVRCREADIDVVLTDMRMPGMDGLELLEVLSTVSPDSEVVLMTAYGTVETAVDAIKKGAYDFVEKPVKRAAIVKTVKKALERHFLVKENRILRRKLKSHEERTMVGTSRVFRKTVDMATQAASSVATILITGESGTGKEIIARYIHDNSLRPDAPFVAVNCAALPESILEAELFGYEVGAFTGATRRRDGRFALADGGTIFLDEVGDMSPSVQVKLLRTLQEREIEPLGGSPRQVDVRILAATNRDLDDEVAKGAFREDLYYRLNVIGVHLPALRQRLEDVPLLVDLFLQRFAERNKKTIRGITQPAMALLCGYYWPGNVRQLENVIERAVVLSDGEMIDVENLPATLREENPNVESITVPVGTSLDEIELQVIKETLRYTQGDKRQAAQLLGIATRTIYRKLDNL